MFRLMIATILLWAGFACKERQPLESTAEATAQTADQVAEPEVIIIERPVEAPVTSEDPAVSEQEQAPVPPPPPPVIYLKAGEKYNEYCPVAKKIDITDKAIKLTTDNFALKLEALNSDSVQCIITIDATVMKGKRLVPVVNAQSYFSGLGMLVSGQSMQVDYNILTLNGDNIEASLEYQSIAQGPIGSDTEFVRSLQLLRRISPPCQTTDLIKRTLVLQVLITLDKNAVAGQPFVTAKDLPRIDYTLENCT